MISRTKFIRESTFLEREHLRACLFTRVWLSHVAAKLVRMLASAAWSVLRFHTKWLMAASD